MEMGNSSDPWTDREWLQNMLRAAENDPSLSITDYHVKDMHGKGDHFMSEMLRITVHLQRAGNQETTLLLIAKKLPSGIEMQKRLANSAQFPNEITTYSQILPKYQTILEAAAPGLYHPFTARHFCSQNKFPHYLIISDLAPEGFKMATRQRGLDLDHCLLVMRILARYHAASVALHEREPQLVESLKENILSEKQSSDLVLCFSNPSILSVAKVVRSWPDRGEDMANRLLKVADTFCDKVRQQLSTEGNRLNVLIHGDLCINNLLFKHNDASGSVEDVRLVDFQQGCFASFAIDLQFFIHTSPRDDVRVAHTNDILKEYHKELCSKLKLLACHKKIITFEQLLEEYENKGLYGFLMGMEALPFILAPTENAPDMEAVFSGDDQSQYSDNRAANEELVKVMKRILPIFEQKGYF